MVEGRIASLEVHVGHLREDVAEIKADHTKLATEVKEHSAWRNRIIGMAIGASVLSTGGVIGVLQRMAG